MNDWSIKKLVICEADDFMDRPDRSGLNYLLYWKHKYLNFKITLFTIPHRTNKSFLDFIGFPNDWVELAVHGWDHESNFECYGWDEAETKMLMNSITYPPYTKIFKAPGWTIRPGHGGYPAAPEDPINADPQGIYKGLRDLDFIVVDRHEDRDFRPPNTKIICIDDNPDIIHMHTWRMNTPNPDERNGFEQVEMRGTPWDNDTTFFTIGEAWQKGLIKPCQE